MCGCLLRAPHWGTWPTTQACALTANMNQRPFSSQASAQSTEPHQPGQCFLKFNVHASHLGMLLKSEF